MIQKIFRPKNIIYVLLPLQFFMTVFTANVYSDWVYAPIYSIVMLVILLTVPLLAMRKLSVCSYFRFQTLFLAFIPAIKPEHFYELTKTANLFTPEITTERCLTLLSVFSKELLPVMLVLFVIYSKFGNKIKKWYMICLAVSALLGAGMLCFPALSELLLYFMTYILLIPTLDFLNSICNSCKEKYEKILIALFWTLLFFRGLYQQLAILYVYFS